MHLLDAGYDIDLVDAAGNSLAAVEGDSVREALLDHLTDARLGNAYELAGAIGPGDRARGQLLIAVLGRLSHADAITLTNARRDVRLCRAIIIQPAPDGDDDASSSSQEFRCLLCSKRG